jgi:hypothetical protein
VCVCVYVCEFILCCYYRIPQQIRYFLKNRNLYLILLKDGKSNIKEPGSGKDLLAESSRGGMQNKTK